MSPKKAKKRAEGANSNVFSMFEQTQIQEFKEVGAAVARSAWGEAPPVRTSLSPIPCPLQGPLAGCLYPPSNPTFGLCVHVNHF
uniref:Myosin light chain 2 n=1 Tax=Equus asinus TaxID=9793 RepID=A0A9L0KAT8_EQUAS